MEQLVRQELAGGHGVGYRRSRRESVRRGLEPELEERGSRRMASSLSNVELVTEVSPALDCPEVGARQSLNTVVAAVPVAELYTVSPSVTVE